MDDPTPGVATYPPRSAWAHRRGWGAFWLALLLGWAAPNEARAEPPVYAQLAGGLVLFPGDSPFSTGAAFGVSVGWRATSALAVEGGYLGTVFTHTERAIAAIEHGGYAALLAAPFELPVSPYALAGVEVSHRRTAGEEQDETVRPGTFVRIPVGAGADARLGLFTIGARGVYDLSLREGREGGATRAGDRIVITLRLGAEF